MPVKSSKRARTSSQRGVKKWLLTASAKYGPFETMAAVTDTKKFIKSKAKKTVFEKVEKTPGGKYTFIGKQTLPFTARSDQIRAIRANVKKKLPHLTITISPRN